jgi:hypothetical protein
MHETHIKILSEIGNDMKIGCLVISPSFWQSYIHVPKNWRFYESSNERTLLEIKPVLPTNLTNTMPIPFFAQNTVRRALLPPPSSTSSRARLIPLPLPVQHQIKLLLRLLFH